ncbi:hypothetical protein H9P43_008482 [Blastocladiella emersonii ATCC 22665]|nr:hypothetical protein H9P43_008482 [Blastocladiella emersonii ATCC 22665]
MSSSAKRLYAQDASSIQALSTRIGAIERAVVGEAAAGTLPASRVLPPVLAESNILAYLSRVQLRVANASAQSPELEEALSRIDDVLSHIISKAKDPFTAADPYTMNQWLLQRDLQAVPLAAKLAIVESAEPDVKETFSNLLKLDALNESLNVDAFEDMAYTQEQHAGVDERTRQLDATVRMVESRVHQIMSAYGAYVDNLSEVFVNLDEQLRMLERHVTELETRRRNADE